MTPPTLPPEIEAALTTVRGQLGCAPHHADDLATVLRTAITSALAAAREAGRRDALADAQRHIATHAGDRAAACDAAVAEIAEAARSGGDTVGPAIRHAVSVVEVAVAASDRAKREVLEGAPGVEEAIGDFDDVCSSLMRVRCEETPPGAREPAAWDESLLELYRERKAALLAAIAAEIRGARADAIAECKAASTLDVYPAADDAIEAFRVATWSEALCSLNSDGAPTHVVQASIDAAEALRAIAADKARAVEGLRPVLSREDAERLVKEYDAAKLPGEYIPARAALLAALTGAGGGS